MLDPEAATLRHALRTAHREGIGRAYPKALHQRVVAYAQQAASAARPHAEAADALGLSLATLDRWVQPARPTTPAFRPVVVVAPEPARAAPTGGVAIVLPGGVRVEGLSVEQAAKLCRRLR